jgi:hypothetical protein
MESSYDGYVPSLGEPCFPESIEGLRGNSSWSLGGLEEASRLFGGVGRDHSVLQWLNSLIVKSLFTEIVRALKIHECE